MPDAGRPPIVFLPGMMLDGRQFRHQLGRLGRRYPAQVADITRGASIEAIARDVLRTAPPRFALVGLSMGGIVALEIHRQAPERLTHLALLDTTPYADLPERTAVRLEQIAAVERGELVAVLRDSLKPRYLARCNRGNHELLGEILDMGVGLGKEVFRRQSMALKSRGDSSAVLPTIRCPALVLCGREDQLCTVAVHANMAEAIPRADLMVLADVGHLSTMEAPDAVSGALEHLLSRAA